MNVLPIHGLRDRYETKWFTETRDEVKCTGTQYIKH